MTWQVRFIFYANGPFEMVGTAKTRFCLVLVRIAADYWRAT
jgi:hypothetical protein